MGTRVEIDREDLVMTSSRKIRKYGNSTTISIPPELLQGTGLSEGDDVILEADIEGGTILVKTPDEDESDDEDADEE
jgi:antitoxin component of MazEF toxin-antitoxin module